jgi:hypothetical protein
LAPKRLLRTHSHRGPADPQIRDGRSTANFERALAKFNKVKAGKKQVVPQFEFLRHLRGTREASNWKHGPPSSLGAGALPHFGMILEWFAYRNAPGDDNETDMSVGSFADVISLGSNFVGHFVIEGDNLL